MIGMFNAKQPEIAHRQKCAECGSPIRCLIAEGKSTCWCFHLPTKDLEAEGQCLCRRCLDSKPNKAS